MQRSSNCLAWKKASLVQFVLHPNWGILVPAASGFASEEPNSSQVCGYGTVHERMQEGWHLGLALQRELCLSSIPHRSREKFFT